MPSLQSCPQKMVQKRLLLSPRFLGFLLVTCIVEEQHFGSKRKKRITLTAPNFQMLIALRGL